MDASLKKLLNCHNSTAVQRIATKFGTMTHFDPLNPMEQKNWAFKKFNMVGGRHLENH